MNEKTKNEDFEAVVKQHLEREFTKGMLTGSQATCAVILNKITQLYKKEKPTANDMKRLIKDIKGFCSTGLSRKINPDGTTSKAETSTVQN